MLKPDKLSIALLCLLLAPLAAAQEPLWRLQSGSSYTLTVYSEITPLELNRIHSWELVLSRDDGKPVSDALISVEGGMPLHDHGLPTQPQVNSEVAPGRYLLEGMRFHMPGLWQLLFTISHEDSTETIQLDFEL